MNTLHPQARPWPSSMTDGLSAVDAERMVRLFGDTALVREIEHRDAVAGALQPVAPTPAPLDPAWLRQRVDALPMLPQAVQEAMAVLGRDDSTPDQCAACLSCDPALTARILRLANSAFYGRAGRVATVQDAVVLLGRRTLGKLVTTAAVSAQFGQARLPGFDLAAFWRHMFGAAIAAQALAGELGGDDALAFSAGLLHDIGHLVLVVHAPEALMAALDHAQHGGQPLVAVERQILGLDHAQVGGMVAEHWQFPPAVVAAIVGHHGAPVPEVGAGPGLADLVCVADAVTHVLDLNGASCERVVDLGHVTYRRMGLPPASYQRVFERTESGVAALARELAL